MLYKDFVFFFKVLTNIYIVWCEANLVLFRQLNATHIPGGIARAVDHIQFGYQNILLNCFKIVAHAVSLFLHFFEQHSICNGRRAKPMPSGSNISRRNFMAVVVAAAGPVVDRTARITSSSSSWGERRKRWGWLWVVIPFGWMRCSRPRCSTKFSFPRPL